MKVSFEYDLNKSLSNLQKHGIDFEKAKELFRGNVAVAEAHSVEDEMRKNFMKHITAKEFDEKFDNGEDVSEYLDLKNIKSFEESHLLNQKDMIKIDKDILKFFPDEKSVNDALRGLIKIMKMQQKESA